MKKTCPCHQELLIWREKIIIAAEQMLSLLKVLGDAELGLGSEG